MGEIASIAFIFVIFSLISRRLASTVISAPLFFLLAGLLLAVPFVGLVSFEDASSILQYVGVTALGLSFFNDASRINLRKLGSDFSLPARLLLVGLPLTFLLGAVLAYWLLPGLFVVEAALLAVILTPADTGLISLVLGSERVPVSIRQTINIESSLNDGLTTPIAAILIAFSQSLMGLESNSYRLLFPLQQIAIAILVGVVIGGLGGWALREANQRQWIVPSFQGLVFPSLAILVLTLTVILNGNYFIACFVAGVTLGFFIHDPIRHGSGFSETLTHLLSLVVFLFIGSNLVEVWPLITWQILLYALLSLTVVRILSVAAAMHGKGLQKESLLFLGWFGPRGLASIVLATIVVGNLPGIPHNQTIIVTTTVTVALSILLHGVSAIPLVSWYGRWVDKLPPEAAEKQLVKELPLRLGWSQVAAHSENRVAGWETRQVARENRASTMQDDQSKGNKAQKRRRLR